MNIYTDINQLPAFKNAVITIGSFDGVHNGHRQIIHQLISAAKKVEGTPVVITFYPHPKKIVGNHQYSIQLLNTLEEKAQLLEACGINHLVVVPFTKEFSEMTATEYISEFLVRSFNPHTIIIGYDHRFGKNRTGDYQLLLKYASEYNYQVIEIPEHILQDITISSSKVRQSIIEGNIPKANSLLGYPYYFSGIVEQGNQLGRTIGFPTANVAVDTANKLIPGEGVYAVRVSFADRDTIHNGMMNIGMRPTIGGNKQVIEVNIFDFDEMIYNKEIKVILIKKIRNEMKFEGLEQLQNQLKADKEKVIMLLAN
jgi:riboflavin kinase/FMN adenylyltransferase